jgi:hypothetical protein
MRYGMLPAVAWRRSSTCQSQVTRDIRTAVQMAEAALDGVLQRLPIPRTPWNRPLVNGDRGALGVKGLKPDFDTDSNTSS